MGKISLQKFRSVNLDHFIPKKASYIQIFHTRTHPQTDTRSDASFKLLDVKISRAVLSGSN